MARVLSMKVGVGEWNNVIGQGHPNARFTDHERELVVELAQDGWSIRQIARKLEMSKSSVQRICAGNVALPREYREVRINGERAESAEERRPNAESTARERA